MGFKRGLIIGTGIGYVLGAKAGRERYDEIRRAWSRFTGNPQVQAVAEKTKDVVEEGAKKSLHAVSEGVEKATDKVKDKLHKDDEPAAVATPAKPPTAATP